MVSSKSFSYKTNKRFNRNVYNTVLIVFLIHCISCKEDLSPIEDLKFFNPDKLSELSMNSVGNFWSNDSIDHISNYVTENFQLHAGFLSSIRYSSKSKVLAVSVFKTQETAIDAMEERIKDVAAIILPGDSYGDWDKETYDSLRNQYWSKNIQERIKDRWWWCFGTQRSLFINKWNTIIEVGNLYGSASDSLGVLIEDAAIENAAIEIAARVDALSEKIGIF